MASGEGPGAFYESRTAGADLSAKQYYAVKRGSTLDSMALAAATTDVTIGILQDKPAASGRSGRICTYGRTKAVVDGNSVNIAVNDPLGPSANGRLVKVTADKAIYCAWAEEAATADGVTIEVTFVGNQYFAA